MKHYCDRSAFVLVFVGLSTHNLVRELYRRMHVTAKQTEFGGSCHEYVMTRPAVWCTLAAVLSICVVNFAIT